MIEFIPLKYYFDVYIYFCLFLVVANLLHAYTLDINHRKNIKFLRSSGVVLLVLIIFYLGLRPVSGRVFGDMGTYAGHFFRYSSGVPVTTDQDVFFHYYMKILSQFVNVYSFFFITVVLYILPTYFISKTYFKDYWFYAFLMFVVSFSYYSYGTNGIRNGVATSFFLWGLCYPTKRIVMASFFIIAALCHKTLMLPILAYFLTFLYNNPKTYLKAWFLAIPLSFFLGSLFVSLFTILGFGGDQLATYLSGDMSELGPAVKTGFRWDFLFYSSFPVFAGWYFIIKKHFNDTFYYQIFNTYLICNTFWILVIRANFSNRFAYLSWFLMALVIIYPLLKQHFFKNQNIVIAKVITVYFLFTFLMYFIY